MFEVLDSDVANLEIKAQRGLNLSGVVVAESITDKSALARLSNLRISANIMPASGSVQVMPSLSTSAIGPDGSFQITGLRPGKASVYLSGSSGSDVKGFLITRIEHNGVAQAQGVEIQPGADTSGVRVYLAYGTGVIRGQVKFEGGTLPNDAVVAVFFKRNDSNRGSSTRVDSRGQFVIENLAAGTNEVMVQIVSLGPVRPPPRPSLPVRQTVTVSDGAESQVLLTLDLSPRQGS